MLVGKLPKRHFGFTLTELLVAMVVLSLLAGMVVTAVRGVTRTAREARTRSIIDAIDSVLMQQYEEYRFRPFPVEVPNLDVPLDATTEVGYEVLASEAARIRLMMVRDMQRMEMPDRLSDILNAPTPLWAAANRVAIDSSNNIVGTRDDKSLRVPLVVTWYDPLATFQNGGDAVPTRLASYRSRFPSTFDADPTSNPEAYQNQGAECLYLIMSTSFVGGSPAIDTIPQSNIGDTDGDGLPEILDGWGQPLGFIRWPVGYFDLEQSIDTSVPDDVDLFRSDYAYHVTGSASPAYATDVNATPVIQVRPWALRPLIYSAGPDGQFGITANPWNSSGVEQTDFSYRANWIDWPTDSAHYGDQEVLGRSADTYPFPDPYLRRFIELQPGPSRRLPGQLISTTSAEALADNLSNYR